MANPTLGLAKDLFEDMGRKVADAQQAGDEDDIKIVDEIESLCMNCHADGITRLLLTKIPFFREIIIMSFFCPHCSFKNSEVQPAGEIQQKGHKYTFKIDSKSDLNRQLVKSDTCILRVEDVDLEIPPGRGQLTNLEGILSMIATDLSEAQEDRKDVAPAMYERIEEIITQLKDFASGTKLPFALFIDDPAGNSWIEPSPSDKSGKYVRVDYNRTPEQNASLGLGDAPADNPNGTNGSEIRPEYQASHMYPEMPADQTQLDQDAPTTDDDIIENQVYTFPASCPGCTKPCATNMKMVNIPHFKQVVLMSTVCDHCGYRSNEVKTGGEIPEKGRKITVQVDNKEDLSRDILKSESCAMACPELDLSVEPGTLGGRFTTIEGLLTQVRTDLHENIFGTEDGTGGDSMASTDKARWTAFFAKLDSAIDGEVKFTIVLEDPLAGSYVQSLTAPEPDPQLAMEEYERTAEEEEDLGLTDIRVDGQNGSYQGKQNEKVDTAGLTG
ncbi:zinc finger protein-like protein zpr1 [Venturia nashicola]|uniref:Zinc finger protein-like protein zpr1 n=1 Tax=Venturia nashicola TaxID=86259 RepID=A0A4Z1PAR2_9PEZI|nr:zinc finger protein-like protein zpr1 [Venturia nashicola]TLD34890.1 zinc finger protein-like protein zpr1 [Venturia nashicola]